MCLIVYIPAGQKPPMKERLREAHRANPDGWGFMWAQGGKLMVDKGIEFDQFEPRYLAALEHFPNSAFVIHFRTASMGRITIEACHPHFITDDLALCHNGNLFHFSDYFYSDGQTDSQRLAESLEYGWGRNGSLEDYCRRNYSKIVFMSREGWVDIINEQAGIWENGCWYSNGGIENYVGYGYSGAYQYHEGDVRHKGGLISVQGYSGEWHQCIRCHGWFTETKNGLCPDCEVFEIYEPLPSD